MNKKDLIKAIAVNGNLTNKDAETALDTVISTIMAAIDKGETVKLSVFGTFSSKKQDACIRRNPRTGERINVPAKNIPQFKFSTVFKKSIAG